MQSQSTPTWARTSCEVIMDKICIVKLRKKIGRTAKPEWDVESGSPEGALEKETELTLPSQTSGRSIPRSDAAGRIDPEKKGDMTGRNISLTLTQEQARALRSNRHLLPLLSGEYAQEVEGADSRGEPIVFRFEFDNIAPARLLKPGEVLQMLRISKSFLNGLVRKGRLKSFKIGRLRRFMLDDILAYLEESQNSLDSRKTT